MIEQIVETWNYFIENPGKLAGTLVGSWAIYSIVKGTFSAWRRKRGRKISSEKIGVELEKFIERSGTEEYRIEQQRKESEQKISGRIRRDYQQKALIALGLGIIITGLYDHRIHSLQTQYEDKTRSLNIIPNISQVQEGYIPPSQLEILTRDLDLNGEPQTVMQIDGQPYLLMYNEQGRPTLTRYEIKPAERVPEE